MTLLLLTFFLSIFSFFNLFGIKKDLLFIQIVFYSIGVLVFFIVRKIGTQFFRDNAKFFFLTFIILLIITYIIGIEVKGSKRWIDLYFFNFQPSEFFKIFFILFFADYFARIKSTTEQFPHFLQSFFYFLVPTLIIFKQPDLANTAVFIVIYLALLSFSKLSKKYLLTLFFALVFFLPFTWFFLKDYQKVRIISFFNPTIDQQGTAYNLIQAVITTGSGGLLGRGLGYGTQSRLLFLPENHTDFAFSSLVEQFGFIGGFCIILFYFFIAYLITKKLINYFYEKDENGKFKFLLTLGFLSYFISQIVVNIGMNLGLLPIAGVALPLISYGGSSLVSFMLGLALLQDK